jgi:diacylglycerol kinase (ATP)
VRGRAVTVSGSEFRCSADGELSEPVRRRAWRLAPAAYRVVAPAEAGVSSLGD